MIICSNHIYMYCDFVLILNKTYKYKKYIYITWSCVHTGDPTFAPATIAPLMISGQQRLRVRVMIEFLVRGRVKIKIRFRVRVGVMFNINIYYRSNYRRSKCRTFVHTTVEPHYNKDLGIMKFTSCCIRFKPLIFRVRPLRPLGHILLVHHQWEDLERAPKYLRPNSDYYITVKKKKKKNELRPAKLPCKKEGVVMSDLFIMRFHCIYSKNCIACTHTHILTIAVFWEYLL